MTKYNNLRKLFNNLYNNKLSDEEFEIWIKKDFKKYKSRKQLINKFIDYEKDIINEKMNLVKEYCKDLNDYELLIKDINNNYFNIKGLLNSNIDEFEFKIKKFNEHIDFLEHIILNYEMNYSINEYDNSNQEISNYNEKYNLENENSNEKVTLENNNNYLNNVDEETNIIDNSECIEEISATVDNINVDNTSTLHRPINNSKFKKIKYKLLNNIKKEINDFKAETSNINEEKMNEKKEIENNNNEIVETKENKKIIDMNSYNKNETNNKQKLDKNYSQLEKEKQIRENNLNNEYNSLKEENQKIQPLAFFDYCSMKIMQDQRLTDNQVVEMVNYINNLKYELLYLCKTTLDHTNDKKVLEMILNADALIEKKLNSCLSKQKKKTSLI